MTRRPATAGSRRPSPAASMWLVFWVSAAVLGFEIALMRELLVTSWHHFAFLVISIALVGFGASGTALTLTRRHVLRHRRTAPAALALATAVAIPLAAAVSRHIVVEPRFVPALIGRQIAAWGAYWCVLTVPFLLGAATIGAVLMVGRRRLPGLYGGNLLGSAFGAVLAPAMMLVLPPAWLPLVMAAVAALGAVPALGPRGVGTLAIATLLVVGMTAFDPPAIRMDAYKYGAFLDRLVDQGDAERLATVHGPRGRVSAVRGNALHDLPFLAVGEAPPALAVITVDGHWAGSVIDVATADDAAVVERTMMAVPYALLPPSPVVALLGERGTTNVWLARRHGAARIDIAQPLESVFALHRGVLLAHGGAALDAPGVRTVVATPRHMIDHAPPGAYDLVQLAGLESSAAGSGGVAGLGQEHLLTIEGLEACLESLAETGILSVCRGIQTPPRDNVKLLATIDAALRRRGVVAPGRHVVVLRDYLAVCTMARVTPWTEEEIERVRALAAERELTPVWFDGIRDDELNQPDALPAPPDGIGDWYHHVARRILSGEGDAIVRAWAFDVRPPTDDRPFFHDFCRLRSVGALRRAFGDLWLTRAEAGYLLVLAAAVVITAVGAILTLAPLPLLPARRRGGRSGRRSATVAYFAALGLGYLLLEMALLARFERWIGDPLLAAAVTIAGFLVLSGAGSLTAQRLLRRADPRRTPIAARALTVVVIAALLQTLLLPAAGHAVAGLSLAARCVAVVVVIGTVAYPMGFPMACGLARLDRAAPALVPWAWGVNGFASVLAVPLATAVGMAVGFGAAALSAIVLYAVAALVFHLLPGGSAGARGSA